MSVRGGGRCGEEGGGQREQTSLSDVSALVHPSTLPEGKGEEGSLLCYSESSGTPSRLGRAEFPPLVTLTVIYSAILTGQVAFSGLFVCFLPESCPVTVTVPSAQMRKLRLGG